MDTDFSNILVWNVLVLNKTQFAHLETDSPSHHIIGKFKAVELNGSKTRRRPCLHPQLLWRARAVKPWAFHLPKGDDNSYSATRSSWIIK